MLPYWVLFAVFALAAINYRLQPRDKTRRLSPFMIAALVATMAMIGLRDQVGADWENYEAMYEFAARSDLDDLLINSDPGYLVLNWFAAKLGFEIWFVNFVCAAIFILGLSRFVKGQPNPWLAVSVAVPHLIIIVAMGYTRQAVAIGIILAAFAPFQRGKFVQFILLFVLAASFHKTAIVVLPLIALSTVKNRFVVYTVAAAIGTIIFLLFLDTFLNQLFQNYLDTGMSADGAAVRVAMNVVPAVVFLTWSKYLVISADEKIMWRNFSLVALAMVPILLLVPSSTAVDRVALYLIPLQIFVLSRLPYAVPSSRTANPVIMTLVIAYGVAVQFVWLNFATHAQYWFPYRSVIGS